MCLLTQEIRINPDQSATIVYQQGCKRIEVKTYTIIYPFNFDHLNFEFCTLNMYSFERL